MNPTLRFKDDNGNDYPDWEEKKLGDVFSYVSDKNHPEEEVLTIIQGKGTLPRSESGRNIIFNPESLPSYKLVHQGEFIIHLRSFEGGFEMSNSKGIVSPAYTILKSQFQISSLFYKAYFRTNRFIHQKLCVVVEGIRDGKQINIQELKDVAIPVPSLPEQQKIASFLSSIDEKITLTDRQLELMKQYKQGVMQQIFSQEIRFKDDNGNDYPDWEEKKLGNVVSIKSPKYNPDSNQHLKCVELDCIKPELGVIDNYYNSDDQQSIKNKFKQGDVLFGKLRPYLRKYAVAPFDGVCSTEIWVLTSEVINNIFLFYLVQTDSFIQLSNKASGSKMPRADWGLMSNELINYPSLPEQQKIASFLSSIDEKITLIDRQLENLKQYKKSLLQQMFV